MTDHRPFGSAQVSEVSVRADANSYGFPVSLAFERAKSSSLMEPSATGSAAAPAAAALTSGSRTLKPVAAIPMDRTAAMIREILRLPGLP
ncbi:hypothetical protein [Streptomyces sp. NPDC059979]|uniref:hypothetical protein n=1 Tax=Streptomyces sp. NPDC059979 TaxID=3347021 RepID=UPI0036A0FE03